MTIQQLNDKLTKELIKFLQKKNHYNTGTLAKSIGFASTISNKGELELKLNAKEYIQYLDDGDFLDEFFESNEFQSIMYDWYNDNLI